MVTTQSALYKLLAASKKKAYTVAILAQGIMKAADLSSLLPLFVLAREIQALGLHQLEV